MTMFAWVLAVAALGLQALNVVWAFSSTRSSHVYLVPVLLWYVGLVIRGKGFFLLSSGEEIFWVLVIHITFSVLLAVFRKIVRRT